MKTEKANLDRGNEKYSKIDLADVDSWLPPEAALFLSKTIAARGWSQLSEAVDSNGGDAAEWDDMPKVARDYHLLMELELLETDRGCPPVERNSAEVGRRRTSGRRERAFLLLTEGTLGVPRRPSGSREDGPGSPGGSGLSPACPQQGRKYRGSLRQADIRPGCRRSPGRAISRR